MKLFPVIFVLLSSSIALMAQASHPESRPVDTTNILEAKAPGAAFIQGEALTFSLKPSAGISGKWVLRDYAGEVIRQGEWPDNGKGNLVLEPLSNGYYKLEFLSDDTKVLAASSFAVVPDPDQRIKNPDMFFAMDTAQSWLAVPDDKNPRQPENSYEIVAEVARRAGLQMVRDRFKWSDVEPVPGQFDWKQYRLNIDLLTQRGIKISNTYHDAPAWSKTNTSHLPGDMLAAYNFAKTAAQTFKGKVTNWEFWNEQDIPLFSAESGWDYASCLKAAYLGFKAGNSEATIAIGGFASLPNYVNAVMGCGTSAYFDIFNVHSYKAISEFPEYFKEMQDCMQRYGFENKPLWITENGSELEGSGEENSYIPGFKVHSSDQEMLVSEFLSKMMVSMQHFDVQRDFFFVLTPYNEREGEKDWAVMRYDYTVKPAFAAFATLVDRLGNATPEGTVDLGAGLKGYLYRQKDGSHTLVYWSVSEVDSGGPSKDPVANQLERSFSLPEQSGPLRGVNSFGTPFTTNGDNIVACRYPAFLDNVTGIEVQDPSRKGAAVKTANGSELDLTIVYRTELGKDFKLSTSRDYADAQAAGAKFKLQIWNLAEQPKRGRISIKGGEVTGIPDEIAVPAFGKTELEIGFTQKLDETFKGELRIEGVFNGRNTSPHVIPLRGTKEMAEEGHRAPLLRMSDPAGWRKNSAGIMEISYDEAEEAIFFRTRFAPKADRWTYPEFVLSLPEESLENGAGLAFEVKVSDPDKIQQMIVMLELSSGKSIYLYCDNPSGVWGKCFVQFPPDLDVSEVKGIKVGINSLTDDITYWLRNMQIIYGQ